jgi:subtilisin family serine protease
VISTLIQNVVSVNYRGNNFSGPFTSSQLINYGIRTTGSNVDIFVQSSSDVVDLQDAISDGIIVVGAAGNSSEIISSPGDVDYNNFVIVRTSFGDISFYYNRGAFPGSAANAICVGAVDFQLTPVQQERKASYSNRGTRIDVFAPGTNIVSSYPRNSSGVSDPRDPSFKLASISGTSMASPQVTGVLACLAERWPTMTQTQAREYIIKNSKVDQLDNGSGNFSLEGAPNRYLYAPTDRLITGNSYPIISQGVRPASGVQWPRQKIYRYGR